MVKLVQEALTFRVTLSPSLITTASPEVGTIPPIQVEPEFQFPLTEDEIVAPIVTFEKKKNVTVKTKTFNQRKILLISYFFKEGIHSVSMQQ